MKILGVQIKLLATDLDGTLLNPFGQISATNKLAIERARKVGISTIAATARSIRSTGPISSANGLGPLAICQNGASIYRIENGELLFHSPIEQADAEAIIIRLKVELPGVIFAIEKLDKFIPEGGFFITPLPGLVNEPVNDILTVINSPVTKIIVRHPKMPHKELKEAALNLSGKFADVTSAGADWVDFQSPGTSKASGLKCAAEMLKIDQSQIAAIGDQTNDIEMLKWASYSAAPANAHIEAKRAADWEAPTNINNGVASFIDHLLSLDQIH